MRRAGAGSRAIPRQHVRQVNWTSWALWLLEAGALRLDDISAEQLDWILAFKSGGDEARSKSAKQGGMSASTSMPLRNNRFTQGKK